MDGASYFPGASNTEEINACVNELLINQSTDFKIIDVQGKDDKFKARLLANIKSEAELANFRQNYETLRINKRKHLSEKSSYLLINYYRCQHNTRNLATRDISSILKNAHKRLKNTLIVKSKK